MNLLSNFIPEYSGHVKSIDYCRLNNTLEVMFFDNPENLIPSSLLRFIGVSELRLENYDLDDNCIELVIGIDPFLGGYCLHTDKREFTFKAKSIELHDIRG